MKTRTAALVGLGFFALAGGAAAQPYEAYSSGLLHSAVGDISTVDGQGGGRKVKGCCLGSSGEDGIDIRMNTAWGGGAGIEAEELLASTGFIVTEWMGSDGLAKGRSELISNGDGTVLHTVDFTDLGATDLHVMVYDQAGVLTFDGLIDGPTWAGGPIVPDCPDGQTPIWWQVKRWDPHEQKWTYQWVWSCAVGYNLHGDWYPGRIVIIPVLPAGVPEDQGVDTMRITGGGFNELSVLEASLSTFGVGSWGTGQAHLGENCELPPCTREQLTLVADNIGGGGGDGVGIDLGLNVGEASIDFSHEIKDGTANEKFYDDAGRLILHAQRVIDPDTGEQVMTLDFSGMGATEYDAEFFDPNGNSLGTARLRNYDATIGHVKCPQGWRAIWVPIGGGLWAFSHCEPIFALVVPGLGTIGPVASATFEPVGGARGLLRSVEISGTDAGGSVIVHAVTVGRVCPGDIDGDGAAGLADLSTLLSHFGTTSGATYYMGDLNGDGAVGLADLSLLLSSFGTSCP